MAEFEKRLPMWNAPGIEPPLDKTDEGWKKSERPPAEYMNFLHNTTFEALKELQESAVHKDTMNDIQEKTNSNELQLQNKEHFITCKELNMIPDDINESTSNYIKLTTAIQERKIILVDNRYYIKNTSSFNVPTIPGLSMLGVSDLAELVIPETSWLWKPKNESIIKNIKIADLKFSTPVKEPNSGVRIFFSEVSDVWYIENLEIRNCVFDGRCIVFRSKAPLIDPTITTYGFKRVKILENTFLNANFESETIGLADYPHEEIIAENNRTFNQDGVWLYIGTTNEHPYIDKLIRKMRKCIFKNNRLINSDDFWSGRTYTYNCLLLYEGVSVEYVGNHVEGIKTDNPNTAMYDAYLSADEVISTNNTYKNNIHANPGIGLPALMKSKGGPGTLTRLYDGNRYIVEETWISARMTERGLPLSNISHDLFSLVSRTKSYTIRNCFIDVYYLNMNNGNVIMGKLLIENNRIQAKFIGGSPICAGIENGYTESFVVRNNEIIEKQLPSTLAYGKQGTPFSVGLIYIFAEGAHTLPKLIVSKNKLTAYNSYELMKILGEGISIDDVECCDNEMIYPDLSHPGVQARFLTTGKINVNKILMENNRYMYDYIGTPIAHYGISRSSFVEANIKLKYTGKMQTFNSGVFGLNGDKRLSKIYNIVYKMKIFHDSGYDEFYFVLKYYYDSTSGRNAIEFTDLNNTIKKMLIPKSTDTTTPYVDPNDNLNIKLNPITPTIKGHTFLLRANSTVEKFALIYWTPGGTGADFTKKWTYELEILTSVTD